MFWARSFLTYWQLLSADLPYTRTLSDKNTQSKNLGSDSHTTAPHLFIARF